MFSYCVTKDKDKDKDYEKVYLVSYHEKEIDAYCKENDLEVLSKPKYVEPAMVSHHFYGLEKIKSYRFLKFQDLTNISKILLLKS